MSNTYPDDEIQTLDSKVVYQNRWMTVREDAIGRDDGYRGIYGVIDKPDFVVVIALSGDDVYLVEQYRYPVKGRHLEFPQGAKEGAESFDALSVAKAELREECGLLADNWQYVGEQFLAYGMCSQRYHIFVATELTGTSQALEDEEQGLIVHKMPLAQLKQRIVSGEMMDATTCNAFGLATLKGFL
ncbi:NUDIX domain-containing protein [Alteromonas gilva]|uniref:GDP-mannose pyrophosphatase n=1 Tax=Alteromonas gilva TaxID=2987522 RepID=A0ABT5L3T3_9ALTE|nr:NUDIX hydrolase [Alteromonas gilva]MDC8831700.1 NUDIX hydrolase [Alteromonas gilva]